MLLAIDAGNTNTVFAVHDGAQVRGRWRITTNDARTAEEYVVWLKQLMEMDGIALGDITGSIISTVVPQALFNLQRLAQRYCGSDPVVVGAPGIDLGLDVRVDRPQEVGADRLVNAVAAHKTYDGALIVVDFGTATTFDVVAADGGYEGGIIAPGINLSLEALHSAAAKLPRIAVEKPQTVVGKATVPAMQSGVFWGYIGLIEGLVTRIRADQNDPTMKVIATGGLAAPLSEGTTMIDVVDHDLTIRGLIDIYALNRASA
ncbi:MAG: type III pantothenate kinase [Alphaproteobacteria bacterium]